MTTITIPCECGRSSKIDVGFALPEAALCPEESREKLEADRESWRRIAEAALRQVDLLKDQLNDAVSKGS